MNSFSVSTIVSSNITTLSVIGVPAALASAAAISAAVGFLSINLYLNEK